MKKRKVKTKKGFKIFLSVLILIIVAVGISFFYIINFSFADDPN